MPSSEPSPKNRPKFKKGSDYTKLSQDERGLLADFTPEEIIELKASIAKSEYMLRRKLRNFKDKLL